MILNGWPTRKKLDRIFKKYLTIHSVGNYKNAIDVFDNSLHKVVGSDVIDAVILVNDEGTAIKGIEADTHGLRVGDLIRFTSGSHSGYEYRIEEVVDADNFLLDEDIDHDHPVATDTFDVLRPVTPIGDSSGNTNVVDGGLTMGPDKGYQDIGGTPIVTGGYTTFITLTNAIKKIHFVNNSGHNLLIAKDGVDAGYLPKGAADVLDFVAASGVVIGLKAVGSDTTSGEITINTFR